jgi:hypothetical protein
MWVRVWVLETREIKSLKINRKIAKMADLLSASSNQLAEMLADWNEVLQQSKLGKKAPINNNERENSNAPRNRHLTGSRGRKSS